MAEVDRDALAVAAAASAGSGEPDPIDWRNLPPVSEDEQPTIKPGWTPSQTFLKHHDRCDRAAMLYLAVRGGAGGHQLNRGAIWHDVAAELTRLAIRRNEPRIESTEIAKDYLLDYMRENPHLQVSAVERDALRYMIANFALGEYWEPQKVVALETTVTIEIGGWRIICRIDRADDLGGGVLEVTDYKTSFNMADSEEFKGESFDEEGNPRFAGDFQTMLYALALAYGVLDDGEPLGGGYERFKLVLKYPRYLKNGELARREVVVTQQQLLDFKLDVELQLERLAVVNFGERRWQPTPGTHCRECPAEFACPLPMVLRAESQIANCRSIEDLERLAANWNFMVKRAGNLKRRIKARAIELGEEQPELLDLGDGEIGVRIGSDLALIFIPREREEIVDKERLLEAADRRAEYGERFDLSDHVKVSHYTEFDKRKVAPRRRNGGSK